MSIQQIKEHWLEYSLIGVWLINCVLAGVIAVREVWVPYMNAGTDNYIKIQSEPFDGTVMPIRYIPDWTHPENQDKSKSFSDIPISEYLPIPAYDPVGLLSDLQNTRKSSIILHYTYTVPYMGSYKLNYKENDGSHLGVDIRAPIGTPVLSIANGVVVRTVEADSTGNKFIVVRHDGVPMNGKTVSLYSGYLHLSQITVAEGTRIKKGDMIGRVGITGITTTPHLHFQIDTADAPFHPYWPFTSSDSRNAGLSLFESINAGIGKENALAYTINPLVFVNTYLGGFNRNVSSQVSVATTPPVANTSNPPISTTLSADAAMRERELLLGSYTSTPASSCENKRFSDISPTIKFGQELYNLVDTKCMFQQNGKFNPRESVTVREVVTESMKYFGIEKANGTSPYLDLSINDPLQGYAVVLYRRGVVLDNYLQPDKILSKAEAVGLIAKIGDLRKNPSQIKIYADVTPMNPYFSSIQDYGYMIKARGGRFFPDSILTRSVFAQLLILLERQK